MSIALFSTNERGPDHGPVYFMTTAHSKATEITRAEYLAMLDMPGEWREGDYHIADQTPQDAHKTNGVKKGVLVSTRDYWRQIYAGRLVYVSRLQNRVSIIRKATERYYTPILGNISLILMGLSQPL